MKCKEFSLANGNIFLENCFFVRWFSSPRERSKLWLTAGKRNYPGKINSEKNVSVLAFSHKTCLFQGCWQKNRMQI